MKFRVLTPNKDITDRITKPNFIVSAESFLEVLNFVAKLPNVYTITELPDSCFDFNGGGLDRKV